MDPRITLERLVTSIALPIGRWDRDARLVFCTDHYLTWAGQPRESLLGRTHREIFGEEAWRVAAPLFAQALAGHSVTYQHRVGHGPAAGRWARIQASPDIDAQGRVDAVFTIATDIHDDVLAREALQGTQHRIERFAVNIPYPLTYVDTLFILQFVNKAYCEATGTSAEQLIGRHIGEVRGASRWSEHAPYFQRALEGRAVQYTRLVNSLPQGPRWMRTSYVPDLGDAGEVLGVYTVTIDVHELRVAQEKLRRRVERDSLTDVLSRQTIMDRVAAAVADAACRPVALYFVDLDGFKAVNDHLGHHEGDALLVAVGAALQASVRAEDAVGRFGGDEFLVLAPIQNADGAKTLADHMLEAIQAIVGSGQLASVVSASIGYAMAPADALEPLALLQLADDAMYAAKRFGKNRTMHCGDLSFIDAR